MLSNLLKNNLLGSIVLVLLVSITGFFIPFYADSRFVSSPQAEGALFTSFKLYGPGHFLMVFLSAVCAVASAFLINLVLNNNETLTRASSFPAFVSMLISFEALTAYDFHPAFLANLLVIMGLMRMMQSYRVDQAKAMFFDGGFLISAATLIYFPSVTVVPLVFISLIILRPFVWREWAMALLGIFAPHFIAGMLMYLLGTFDKYYNCGMFSGFDFTAFQPGYGAQYFVIITLAFLFLLLVFNRLTGGSSRKIRQQKNINILSFWLVLGAGSVFYDSPYVTSIPILCIPPVAGLLSEWLGNFRRNTLSDFALFLLIAAFTLSVLQIYGVI